MKRIFNHVTILLFVLIPFLAGCASLPTAKSPIVIDSAAQKVTDSTSSNTNTTENARRFTIEELTQYNGQNGKPAYVAIKGIVYDVTNAKLWQGGSHSPIGDKNMAGKDLTAELAKAPASHQNQGFWDKLPKVGVLESTSR